MKKVVCSILFSVIAFTGFGQIWNPVGAGLSNNTSGRPIPFSIGNNLGVAYYDSSGSGATSTMHVDVWNGVTWNSYPSLAITGWGYLQGAGSLGATPYVLFNYEIQHFNGTVWTVLPMPSAGNIQFMEEVNGELLIQGNFNNGDWGYLYDGTSFTTLPTPISQITYISDAISYNGETYISGHLDSNSISGALDILKLTTSGWVNPVNWIGNGSVNPWSRSTDELVEFNSDLYTMSSAGNLFKLSNDSALIVASISHGITDAIVYSGEIYISNGGTAGNIGMSKYDGTVMSTITQAPRALYLTTYQGELYGFSYLNMYNGVNYNHAFRTQAGFSFINGKVFADADADCALDGGELGVPAMSVQFNTGNAVTSDRNGNYSINLAPGTYSISAVTSVDQLTSNVAATCALPSSISLVANASVSENIATALPNIEDVSVHIISPWRARYGFTESYTVVVSNLGQPVGAGSLELEIPASVNVISTVPSATQTGTTLSWSLSAMNSFDQQRFTVQLEIDTNMNTLGDTLALEARVIGYPADVDVNNNIDPIFQEVRGAYDPNDKQVNIELAEPGSLTLDYYIRFQNTGNDTAYKVTIVDSLSSDLDASSFMMLGATHEYEVMLKNNIASFVFENILLPDSSVSQEKSQGGLRFRINTTRALVDGESVSNDAYIYFDFQQPIHTNDAITEVKASISLIEQRLKTVSLELFPNPAKSVVNLKSTSNQREEVRLIDASGRIIKQISIPAKGNTTLDVSVLEAGMYFVTTGTETYKILIER